MRWIMILSAILLATTAMADDPDRDDVARYLTAQLPAHLTLDRFEFEVFPLGGGLGRVSVLGDLATTMPLYRPVTSGYGRSAMIAGYVPLVQEAVPAGERRDRADSILRAWTMNRGFSERLKTLYTLSARAPRRVPFRAELQSRDTVAGVEFTGRPQYDLGDQIAETEARAQGMLLGSPEQIAFIRALVAAADGDIAREQESRLAIEAYLRNGTLVGFSSLAAGQPAEPVFVLDLRGPTQWRAAQTNPDRTVVRFEYEQPAELTWLRSVEVNRRSYVAGNRIEVAVAGLTFPQAGPLADATLEVFLPEMALGRRVSLTYGLRWQGEGFVSRVADTLGSWVVRGMTSVPEVQAVEAPPADAAATPALEQVAAEPPRDAPAETGLDGLWATPDGRFQVRFTDGVGIVESGGSGARPNGIDMVRSDSFDGTMMTGRMRFSGGQFVAVTATLDGDRLNFAGGGHHWHWQRVGD